MYGFIDVFEFRKNSIIEKHILSFHQKSEFTEMRNNWKKKELN